MTICANALAKIGISHNRLSQYKALLALSDAALETAYEGVARILLEKDEDVVIAHDRVERLREILLEPERYHSPRDPEMPQIRLLLNSGHQPVMSAMRLMGEDLKPQAFDVYSLK